MNFFTIFTYEAKHFVRNKFKLFALLLFVFASIFGLHNGVALYQAQMDELAQIEQKSQEQYAQMLENYRKGIKSPEGRPWVNYTMPFWAIWNLPSYHAKTPSTAMVYSIGQAEQYGYYKKLSVWAGPFDTDLSEEISNPERRQRNSLDFAFAVLFLMPLLLIILIYNIRSAEAEQGLLPLVLVQSSNARAWLLARMGFYVTLVVLVLVLLIAYGATLTPRHISKSAAVTGILLWVGAYVLFWSLLFWGLLYKANSILESTLKMIGAWLLLSFVIPGLVHQYVSIQHPPDLMLDLIDVQRDGREKLFEQPDSLIDAQLFELIPALAQTKLANDSSQRVRLRNFSASALANAMVKEVTNPMVAYSEAKNQLIRSSYWFNPVSFFQNQLNWTAETHFEHYHLYRQQIQTLVDKRIASMVVDMWNDVKVDQAKFEAYHAELNGL